MSIEVSTSVDDQVVSKKRVADHGEVYTAKREVDAMLELVKHEAERIESRFLEPACGTGNFLAEVLDRKLQVVESRYSKSQLEFEKYSVIAASSIYGIDILQDNVKTCQDRMFDVFNARYQKLFKGKENLDCIRSVKLVLSKNIIWGDALSLQTADTPSKPIVFSEWSQINSNIKRRDYSFHELVAQAAIQELPLFSDLGDEVFIPDPVKDYPMTNIFNIADD